MLSGHGNENGLKKSVGLIGKIKTTKTLHVLHTFFCKFLCRCFALGGSLEDNLICSQGIRRRRGVTAENGFVPCLKPGIHTIPGADYLEPRYVLYP